MRVEIVNGADGGPLFKLIAESPEDRDFIRELDGKNVQCNASNIDGIPVLSVRSPWR
jgi:hypothetical protein